MEQRLLHARQPPPVLQEGDPRLDTQGAVLKGLPLGRVCSSCRPGPLPSSSGMDSNKLPPCAWCEQRYQECVHLTAHACTCMHTVTPACTYVLAKHGVPACSPSGHCNRALHPCMCPHTRVRAHMSPQALADVAVPCSCTPLPLGKLGHVGNSSSHPLPTAPSSHLHQHVVHGLSASLSFWSFNEVNGIKAPFALNAHRCVKPLRAVQALPGSCCGWCGVGSAGAVGLGMAPGGRRRRRRALQSICDHFPPPLQVYSLPQRLISL